MERFTGEFLTTGDASLAEEFLSPDVVLHFAGQQQRGRDTYLAVVAANGDTFEDLVWTVEEMVADGDAVAVRYTMTGTHRGDFAGSHPPAKAVVAQSMAFYRLADGQTVEEGAQLDMLGNPPADRCRTGRVGALPRLVLIDGPHRCRCARREQKA
jgi:steroid delta-isomerase-like uncharacterized protein